MNPKGFSVKRLAIDKANARLIIIISLTVFVVVFCIVAIKALWTQRAYQSRVISAKTKTLKDVESNQKAVEKLNVSYQEFASQSTNILGGNPKGTGDRDGENARIVLDALPSSYDYPALVSSLNKLAQLNGFKLDIITGTDDEINQSKNSGSTSPAPIEIPFTLSASNIQSADGTKFLQMFEKSIRPMKISKVNITGQGATIKILVEAKTYFQPEKKLNIKEVTIR